jgi:hypothetical protein
MSDPDELVMVAGALSAMLRAGRMPPDDAYAWTRVLCELARALDARAQADQAAWPDRPRRAS